MNDINRNKEEFWKWGIFYNNPNDRAIWIDKRTGIGWTLNFAHAESWVIIFMILVIPMAILAFMIFVTG
jgi:uncharacterized membrane protein